MLAGEVLRRRESIARLVEEIADLEAKVAALDEAMQLADSRINPAAAGVVRATSGRYHGRGSFTKFVRDQIVSAGDAGVDTLALCLRAMSYFDIPADSELDVRRFRNSSLRDALRRLLSQGVIERAPRRHGGPTPTVWLAKRDEGLDQLARRAEKSRAEP